ncbi:MAG: UDP-N-acetylglucosamine--N-acetylmuramyl-(pentapeptide) pyrophosphoryl-undecaprenol N-acetylglucosamine transferase [bacterium]|nr:UDP-N-acetylglucosamine--N-acetylmuramyl-(pentapeptide) pyrophosphoryl-undecaprenol N-acetylglucosamine transferase [bacterium]
MIRILFVGGGTAGPVALLLALAEAIKQRDDLHVLGLVGTASGPERMLAEQQELAFFSIIAPKLRRYLDWRTVLMPFEFIIGCVQSLRLILKLRPSVVVSGGSFVGVPLVVMARLCGIPSIIHQQDVEPSLANRVVAPFATKITVTFSDSVKVFPPHKVVVMGNPVRASIFEGSVERAREFFKLESDIPAVLIMGGGTGATALNELVIASLPELTKFCQIVHLTGKGKLLTTHYSLPTTARYHPFELLTKEMADAFTVADVVVARAGVGTITELAALGKPAILIPMPGTHQEANVKYLTDRNAAIGMSQVGLKPEQFAAAIQNLINDQSKREALQQEIKKINPANAVDRFIKIILEI